MRAVKFRAWDNVANEMHFAGEDADLIFQLGSEGIECTDIRSITSAGDILNEMENLVYMQFTGLKDKNGVEIYEGDIIGVELGDQYYFAIVKRGGWYWYGDMVFANDIIDFDDIGDENDMSADCDVLGNIFQNPKLLEENK